MWWRKSKPAVQETTASDPNLPLIRLERVSKTFKGDADEPTRALDEVTVDINAGEFVTVSGLS